MARGRATRVAIAIIIVVIIVASASAAYIVLRSSKDGTVKLYVKDTSGIWAHVNVTFSEVQIHGSGANASWINVSFAGGRTIDLAVLIDVSALLADGKVRAGNFTQIRIVVESATGVMTNGTAVTFNVPSGELKTTKPFSVVAGKTTTLTVDIDLSRSIVQNANGWTLTPVLGSIEVVEPPSGGGGITY